MFTYLECAEELIVADCAVAVAVEVSDEVLGLFLRQVEAVVDEAPPEVLHVQLAVTVVVHRFEDPGNALDAAT